MGEAISVVTMAMMTSVAKRAGEIIPRWSPMLMMMSSINPRAFINVPMPSASRFEMPVMRAASQQATHAFAREGGGEHRPAHQPKETGVEQADLRIQSGVGEEQRKQ